MTTPDCAALFHPTTSELIQSRNNLLTSTLRDAELKWPFASEYPLILDPGDPSQSFCLIENNTVLAHANLQMRTLMHASRQKSYKLALVGNVATAHTHQGQGLQRSLIQSLERSCEQQDAHLMILWSDLFEFYQKLGFSSNGREIRFTFSHRENTPSTLKLERIDPKSLSSRDLECLLSLRPKVEWTIERSVDEFRRLLTIPNTLIFTSRVHKTIKSWFAVGKGSDMSGVIHEWGSSDARSLVMALNELVRFTGGNPLLLLTPACLSESWHSVLRNHATTASQHSMALVKPIGEKGLQCAKDLARGFLWGFDSI
jgi:hypothetical protein